LTFCLKHPSSLRFDFNFPWTQAQTSAGYSPSSARAVGLQFLGFLPSVPQNPVAALAPSTKISARRQSTDFSRKCASVPKRSTPPLLDGCLIPAPSFRCSNTPGTPLLSPGPAASKPDDRSFASPSEMLSPNLLFPPVRKTTLPTYPTLVAESSESKPFLTALPESPYVPYPHGEEVVLSFSRQNPFSCLANPEAASVRCRPHKSPPLLSLLLERALDESYPRGGLPDPLSFFSDKWFFFV